MENRTVDSSINNNFLSQSYSQGIEKITGTKHIIHFGIPKEVLEVREKSWDKLFDKYSENMTDDIEINVDTLEPEEEEEVEVSEEKYSYGRVPMRKPLHLVQYWIDTGNPPHKAFLDKYELSETGSSLSEKEITPPQRSSLLNEVNASDKQKYKSNSSCSSVDTAAYILSNANVTKKADTIAIIEGAKQINVKSTENAPLKANEEAVNNSKVKYIDTVKIDQIIHNNNNVNADISSSDISFSMSTECKKLKTNLNTSAVISNDRPGKKFSKNSSCDKLDKANSLNTSQKCSDVQSIDNIVSIFQHFDKTTKRQSIEDKNNGPPDESESLKIYSSDKGQISANAITEEIIAKDMSLTAFHRKKLYTGRESPVDLILIERHSINKLPKANLKLHPALDSDSTIKGKISVTRKGKSKRRSLGKKKSALKKAERHRRKRNLSPGASTINSNDKVQITENTTETQDSIDSPCKNAHNNSVKQYNDVLLRKCNDTNDSVKTKTCKQDLISLNLDPIVLIKRITPSLKRYKCISVMKKNTHVKDVHNEMEFNISNKLHTDKVEYLEEKADSDNSTIFLYKCKSKKSTSSVSTNSSYYLRLSTEDEFSPSNAEKKTEEALNLEDINKCKNGQPYIILQRLPQTIIEKYMKTIKSQTLNINNSLSTDQEEILNESMICFSDSHDTKKTDNVKLRDPKVILERLPENMCSQRSNNITNIETSVNKNKIMQNRNLRNNKRKSQITTKFLTHRNIETSTKIICDTGISMRMRTRSKKTDNKIIDMSDAAARHENQIVNDLMMNPISRKEDHNDQVSQDRYNKPSTLISTSSDEDSLIRLIQPSKKRLKMSRDNKIPDEANITEEDLYHKTKLNTNTDKLPDHRNLSKTMHSAQDITSRKIDKSTRGRNEEQDEIEMRSSDNDVMLSGSLQMRKNNIFLLSSKSGNNRTTENLDKRKKRYQFLNCSKNMNNNSKDYSDTAVKKNEINHRNVSCVVIFQTKEFDTSSSNSEKDNDIFIHKTLKKSPIRKNSRHHNRNNREKIFNDSIRKNRRKPRLSNSSIEKHGVNRIYSIRNRFQSTIDKKANVNERFANNKFNHDANSSISNRTRDTSYSSVTDDIYNALAQEDDSLSDISLAKNNNSGSLENKQISKKWNINTSLDVRQQNKSAITKSLMFQTKSYYDSDSSGFS